MKAVRSLFLITTLCALAVSPALAEKKSKAPSLKDIISTPQHLKGFLGAKMVLPSKLKSNKAGRELAKVIADNKLDQGTEFFLLPENGIEPEVKTRKAPDIPSQLLRSRVSASAKFLMLIGTDGTVQSLFCYESDHAAFTLAAAQALAAWKYEPAQINGKPVPILVSQTMEFTSN